MSTRSLAILAAAAAASLAHAATTYTVQPLPMGKSRGGCAAYGSALSPTSGIVLGLSCSRTSDLMDATVWNAGHERVLHTPDDGYVDANAVNDAGQAVGTDYGPDFGAGAAVSWTSRGRLHYLPPLVAGESSQAFGVSADGDVAGLEFRASDSAWRPVLWHRGVPSALPMPANQVSAYPRAMSPNGTMAGFAFDATGLNHAVVWSNGVASPVGPAATNSWAWGVNDRGQAVGSYRPTSLASDVPFIATTTSFTPLPLLPGDAFGLALAVDREGVVVGYSNCGCGAPGTAVRWVKGQVADLNALLDPTSVAEGWFVSEANSIDAAGRISATGQRRGGPPVGIVLVPSGS